MVDWRAAFARVRSALMRRGQTSDEAEDLVQEAWVRLACYEKEREVVQPEAFLMRAALNLSVDAYRARTSRGEEVVIDEDFDVADAAPTTEEIMLGRERLARMSVGLGRLNEKTRDIFLAHRIDGLSYQEIARRHQLSISSVEKHIAKATLVITSWMEGWYP